MTASILPSIHLDERMGRHVLHLDAIRMGKDLTVCIYGGDLPHIGAAVLAVPGPSGTKPGQISASASVITVCGHMEDEPARKAALYLAARLNVVVSMTCGVHMNEADKKEIDGACKAIASLAERLAERLEKEPSDLN